MMHAITGESITKSFGEVKALRGLDLEVHRGEVHGFLGPNGAGKSTTIRILLGIMRADKGSIEVLGRHPWRDAAELHSRLAYVPGDVSLWPQLSGGECIDLLCRLRGHADPKRREHLIERFALDPSRRGRTYSKGNRQKVAIIAALTSDVELLILDEPTSGLDPLMEQVFQEELLDCKSRGTTVLLSSHILSEVESLCDRASILRDGVTVETGTIQQMRGRTSTRITATLSRSIDNLSIHPGVHELTQNGTRVSFRVDPSAMPSVIGILGQSGVVEMTVEPPSLEQLFLKHYTED